MGRRLLDLKDRVVDRRTRKGIVRVALEAVFEEENCPLCRLLLRQEERWLMVFLTESVLDLGIRRQILASWGFCRRHAWAMATRTDLGGALATAIIHEDLTDRLLQHCGVQAGADAGEEGLIITLPEHLATVVPGHSCPACLARERIERNYIASFNKYAALPAFLAAYQASDGFCPVHLARVLARPAVRTTLLRHRVDRLQAPSAAPNDARPLHWGLPPHLGRWLGRLVGPPPFYPGSIDAQRHSTIVGSRVRSSALDQKGDCSVCQARRRVEEDHLRAMLELDGEDAPRALCAEHAWMLYAAAWRSRAAGPMANWLAKLALAETRELELRLQAEASADHTPYPWPRPRRAGLNGEIPGRQCVICAAQAEAAGRVAAEVAAADEGARAQLCLSHAGLALEAAPAEAGNALRRRLLQRAWGLHAELASYIRKVHWENRHEAWEGEQDSWWRAVRFFVGDE